MIKTIALGSLVIGISVASLQAQYSARQLTTRIRPEAQAPAVPAAAPVAPPQAVAPLVSPLVTAIDTNRNGLVEAPEITNVTEALKKLDKNGDGRLTSDEFLGKGESTASPLVKILDANNDGILEAKELAGAAKSLRMLDKNGDGKLTPSEFRPVAATLLTPRQVAK